MTTLDLGVVVPARRPKRPRRHITPDPLSGQVLRALAVLVYVMCAACVLFDLAH